jgi:hypothetical protein
MTKIDFVLPWVDGEEPYWKQIREKYKNKITDKDIDSNIHARFRDMETLKYTLRSIEKNCPWYNKIYLITKGYFPEWLDIQHDKIELVTEEELFIDKSHLPVFSSVAIEMNLVNLRKLSETFVYMNDDFVIWNSIEPSRFFVDNMPVDFFSHHFLPRNKLFELLKGRDTWIHSINNVLTLFNKKLTPYKMENHLLYHSSYSISDKVNNFLFQYFYKKLIWINHWHHPQPLLKKTLQEVYTAFSDEMMACSRNKFRSNSNLDQYMYRYWQLIHGNFHPFKYNDGLVTNLDSMEILNSMIDKLQSTQHINFVCFNDSVHLTDEAYQQVKNTLNDFLEKRFPDKASFER